MSAPRTEALIADAMKRWKGKTYFEEVHQAIAPLCRELEAENASLRQRLRAMQDPCDEALFELGNAVREEVQAKAPAVDLPTLRNRYRLAWHRVIAKTESSGRHGFDRTLT